MQSVIKVFSRFYLIIIIVVLIVGGFFTFYTYGKVKGYIEELLSGSVGEVATAFGYQNLNLLTGTRADINNFYYADIRQRLGNIKEVNKHINAAYLIGYCKGKPCVFASSETENSPLYCYPGDPYFGDPASFEKVLLNRENVFKNIYSDSRGRWLSALAPVVDAENNVIAGIEMDMAADNYFKTLLLYSSIPAIITIFIILIVTLLIVIEARKNKLLEFKSELVSIASHEIRTPLTGINWLVDTILKSGDNLSQSQKESIIMIRDQGQNLLLIINELLDLSAEQNIERRSLKKQQILFKSFMEEVIATFKLPINKKSLKIIFDSSITADVNIFGDPYRLKRVFNNLVSNAVKYSNPNGSIFIGYEPNKEKSIFWIKDEGIGIPEKEIGRIFESFYRTENAKKMTREGTGLGLSYVKQIVELHRGKAWFKSKENQGSTFFIELPRFGD